MPANQAAAATAGLKLLQLSSGAAGGGGGEPQAEHRGEAGALPPPGPASQLLQWRAAVPAALLASVQVTHLAESAWLVCCICCRVPRVPPHCSLTWAVP